MKLSSKITLSQIVVTLLITVLALLMIPEIIYRNFQNSVRANVTSYSTQIISNISQRLVEIERVTNVLASDTNLKEEISNYIDESSNSKYASISLNLSGFYLRESLPSYKILGIYISMDNGKENFSTVGFSGEIKRYIDENVLPQMEDKSDGMIVSPFKYTYDSSTKFANEFDQVYGYAMPYRVGVHSGTVTVISPYSDISHLLTGVEDFAEDYVLVDGNDHVLYSNKENSGIDVQKTMNSLYYGDSYQIGYVDDAQGFSIVSFTTYGNWKLICRLTRDEIMKLNNLILRFSVIVIIVFEIVANLVTLIVTNRFLRPLQEVSSKMHDVAQGNMHVRIAYQSQDEVGKVVDSFNTMARKLEINLQKLISKEKIEQRLRYGILISKVDPHFIYNTMNTITYLAEQGRSIMAP